MGIFPTGKGMRHLEYGRWHFFKQFQTRPINARRCFFLPFLQTAFMLLM